MSVLGNPLLLGSADQYRISRSLRFNSSDSAYLSRTPSSSGNRRTWTWAAWVKRSNLTDQQAFWSAGSTGTNRTSVLFDGSARIRFFNYAGSVDVDLVTTPVYRDASAWYHVVISVDTTQGTSTNRLKLYINGAQVTTFSTATYPSLNQDLVFNSAIAHGIGRGEQSGGEYFNGYLADVHLIDGQALDPSSFTEVSATTGQLIPKKYTGTFTGNSFWLQFADNSSNTATTLGKDSSGLNNNWTPFNLQTTTGGPTSVAAASGALPIYNTTDTYGATKGSGTRTDSNSSSIVLAIPMDGANNGTTFTDESATIKGSGSAKTISRFGDTKTSTAQSKYYGSSGFFDGTGDYLRIAAGADFSYGLGDFTFECWVYTTTSGVDQIIFSQTSSGNNFVNIALTTTNLLSAQINSSGAGNSVTSSGAVSANRWNHIAVTRSSATVRLFINGVLDGSGTRNVDLSLASIEPSIGTYSHASTLNFTGYISDFRIYKGVAKYTSNFNPPNSTQNATVAAGNDSLVDTPTSYGTDTGAGNEVRGNYCTWNPLAKGTDVTLANGNLDMTSSSSAGTTNVIGTIGVSSGKWYWEITCNGTDPRNVIGIATQAVGLNTYLGGDANGWGYSWDAKKYNNNASSSYGATFTAGDVIGVALDADTGTLTFYKNGSTQGQAYSGLTSGPYFAAVSDGSGGGTANATANFGQRPFAYTAPSGFKALCDTNLPTPVVAKPSTVMDVKLYTGNGGTQTISGLGFSPDFVWIKERNSAENHQLQDIVRGATNRLFSNLTAAESADAGSLTSFNSDGFSLGSAANYNGLNDTYVAWCWDAGSSTVTNTQGSITSGSQVRANPSSGFSVVTWTGQSTAATIGHGLGAAPSLIICKARSNTQSWGVYHKDVGINSYLLLDSTGAATAYSGIWGSSAPTSTVFGVPGNVGLNNNSGWTYVAYCFAPVSGYSSFGSYTGNGSTDGPFVYTGMRPRYLLVKSSSSGGDWVVEDAARSTYNVIDARLFPNASETELSNGNGNVDFCSNGFKLRNSHASMNSSGVTYIYAAFAENPFQYARAR